MSKDIKELLPCPFCGGNDLNAKERSESLQHPGSFFPEHVACRNCPTVRFTGEGAKEQWNKRAPITADRISEDDHLG